ncbi:MAG: LPS export ABC transporter ATP-binding protein [Pseudomonadota bacterium]|nr:LPS export ABC transporter ATP-binding protein [Pseudomonadota bacterium]
MARKELSALNVHDAAPPEPVVEAPRPTGLRVEHIARSFGSRQVVRDVSLHVERGQVAGLLGPNGAGKTTCFYMITGLIPPDSGAIWLDGEDITAQPMYQRARMGLGYLAQEASIFRGMTVEQNVRAVVELHHTGRQAIADETTRLLEELRIDALRDAPASGLSGGERRRCEIARALAGKPSFMLLDEPFAGIDPLAIADIRQVIRYLASQGIGVLITDHNVRETLEIIDHASIISAGSVLFEGKAADVIRDPEVRRVYLGDMYG